VCRRHWRFGVEDGGADRLEHLAQLARIQNEAILKLMLGDIVADDAKLLEALLTLRDEIEAQEAKRDEARQRYEAIPHRKRYLLLNNKLGFELLQVHRKWLDEVERELGRP
jgi:hypothetical protein